MAEGSSAAAGHRDAISTQDTPAAMGRGGNAKLTEEVDDDSEWEYEYSATETDVSVCNMTLEPS